MIRSALLLVLTTLPFLGASVNPPEDDYAVFDGSRRRFPTSCFSLSFGTYQYVGELSNELWRTEKLHGAFALKFEKKINKSFDVRAQFSHGIIDYYQGETVNDTLAYGFRTSLYALELGVKYRLNNDVFIESTSRLSPYIYLGLSDIISSADHYGGGGSVDFAIPFGWGIDFDISERLRVGFMSTFHYTFSDNLDGWDRTRDGDPGNLMDRIMYTGVSIGYRFY